MKQDKIYSEKTQFVGLSDGLHLRDGDHLNTQKRELMKMKTFIILAAAFMIIGCDKEQSASQSEGIAWISSVEAGLYRAAAENKIVMVDFMATWCEPCQRMEDSTFRNMEVIKKAKSFIPVRIDVDKQPDVANQYNGNAAKYSGIGIPNLLFWDTEGSYLKQIIGYHSPAELIAVMDSVLIERPRI